MLSKLLTHSADLGIARLANTMSITQPSTLHLALHDPAIKLVSSAWQLKHGADGMHGLLAKDAAALLQDVARAMELANEMRLRNIERNVHTYTALMNVCIKCGKCPLALDTYHHMRQDGCLPNVVTYNTLIDVYGKMGQWDQAVKVLSTMKAEVSASPKS